MSGSLTDEEVPAWWQRLGLPGLVDIHVHFLPPRVQEKVWHQFGSGGPLIGRPWPIHYRGNEEERVEALRALGVRRFSALSYAHRPGMAEWLNDWAADFAARTPDCLRSATFFPEPGVAQYVSRRVGSGTQVFKVHVQVGGFTVTDPLLDDAWGVLADARTPVVVHAGSGPVPGAFTGPGPVRALLERHPRLVLVIAHLGAPEYDEFLTLAEEFPRVHLDTTMAFTDFFEDTWPLPPGTVERLRDLGDRIVLGSDFPSIPYPYAHQLQALDRLGLGEAWLRAVCWQTPTALLG